ncbi:MAG: hypothetical protein ACK4UP_05720 [Spirosomataceae bacterium]
MRIIFFSILLFYGIQTDSLAQGIGASPSSWNPVIPNTFLTEAGANYAGAGESPANQTSLSFSVAILNSYRVSVRKIDTDWNANIGLFVRRTGDGGGLLSGSAGGLTYIQLTGSNQTFFTFSTGLSLFGIGAIPVQYAINGLSVLIPAKTYTTTVVYTISNN